MPPSGRALYSPYSEGFFSHVTVPSFTLGACQNCCRSTQNQADSNFWMHTAQDGFALRRGAYRECTL